MHKTAKDNRKIALPVIPARSCALPAQAEGDEGQEAQVAREHQPKGEVVQGGADLGRVGAVEVGHQDRPGACGKGMKCHVTDFIGFDWLSLIIPRYANISRALVPPSRRHFNLWRKLGI